jgi:hypothetical protein
MTTRLSWQGPNGILAHAADIVRSYDTGVTLRQLFYRLVADGSLPNTRGKYAQLSINTAEARRAGTFPALLDRTSSIERYAAFDGVEDLLDYVVRYLYRRDRTEGQEWTIYLGVEKAGLSEQLDSWFGDPLGLPIVALGGYASQTLADQVRRDIENTGRPAVLVYAGDMDPTGEDIDRDFERRVGVFDKVIRVALSPEQVTAYNLPFNSDPAVMTKLENDPRAAGFMLRHGIERVEDLVQFEVDALRPDTLRDLYRGAVDQFWDADVAEATLALERAELAELTELADSHGEE